VIITYVGGGLEPTPRFAGNMVYDAQDSEFVMFGGCALDGENAGLGLLLADTCVDSTSDILGDTWTWSTTSSCSAGATGSIGGCWVKVCATGSCGITDSNSQTGIYGESMVYDPNSGQCNAIGTGCVLMWGGADYTSTTTTTYYGPCSAAACNTKGWYFVGGTWTVYTALGTTAWPSKAGRAFQSATYVPVASEVFAYGGDYRSTTSAGNCYSRTCESLTYEEFSGSTGAWTTYVYNSASCTNPASWTIAEPTSLTCTWIQEMGAAVYDTSTTGALGSGNTGDVVLFGGCYLPNDDYYGPQWAGGYWTWVPATGAAGTWSLVTTAYPPPSDGPAAFYDTGKGYIIAVGGWDSAIGSNLGIFGFN
jgi:hypothetical protein